MRTTWTLLALSAAGLCLWGGIIAQPWAIGQEATTPREQPTPAAQPSEALNVTVFDRAAVAVPSNPFGQTDAYPQTDAYSLPYTGHRPADPAVAKARQMERKLQQQTRELVAQYANSDDADQRAKIRDSLNELLTQQFELQKEVREAELDRLEAKVKQLRELLDKRSAQRAEIVQRRVDQLMIEADGLGWVDSPSNGVFEFHGEAFSPLAAPVAAPAMLTPTPAPPAPSAPLRPIR